MKSAKDSHSLRSGSKESRIKCRYIAILFAFVTEIFFYAHRMIVSITVVVMVNKSATVDKTESQSCPSYIANTSCEEYVKNEDSGKNDGEFNWTPELQGYVLSCSFFCYVLATAPMGKMTDLFGCKKIMFWGFFLSSTFTFLSPFAAWFDVYMLIIVQSLRGLFQAGYVPAQSVLIANWCPKSERGMSYVILISGSCWGAFIGSYFSGYLCNLPLLKGWPLPYFIMGGAGILCSILLGLFLYDNPSVHPTISKFEYNYIIQNQENILMQKRPKVPWFSLFTSIPVYALTVGYFGQMWAINLFLTVYPTYLGTILHYPIKRNGLLSGLAFLLQFITAVTAGWLSTFLNNKNYMDVDSSRKLWNFVSCIGFSASLSGVYFAGCNGSLGVVFGMATLGSTGFAFAGCWITATDMSPTFTGCVNAISCTIGFTSNFILPVLVGYLTNDMQIIEQWHKVFFISIGIVLSSGLVFAVFGSAKVQPWNDVNENGAQKVAT